MIIWICGLSGSGKSTIAQELVVCARQAGRRLLLVDGDKVRAILTSDMAAGNYSIAGRRKNAEVIDRIVAWLDEQDCDVVVAVQSIFQDILVNHRKKFSNYFEIHLDASLKLLQQRDPKGLHARAVQGEGQHIVGYGIAYERPSKSDVYIDMDQETRNAQEIAADLFDGIFGS